MGSDLKFGSIYVFILKLMNFILLIYFYLVFCFCVKISTFSQIKILFQ